MYGRFLSSCSAQPLVKPFICFEGGMCLIEGTPQKLSPSFVIVGQGLLEKSAVVCCTGPHRPADRPSSQATPQEASAKSKAEHEARTLELRTFEGHLEVT